MDAGKRLRMTELDPVPAPPYELPDFRALLDAIPAAVIVLDGRGMIVFAGRGAAELLESTPGRLAGAEADEFIVPRDGSDLAERISAFLEEPAGAAPDAIAVVLISPSRPDRQAQLRLAQLEMDDGPLAAGLIEPRDLTGGIDLVEFAAVASHDLSTPIQLISGYAALLEESVHESDPSVATAMSGIRSGVQRMQILVDGLLAYARVGREGDAVHRVDTAEVVQGTLDGLAGQLQEASAKVEVGDLPVVLGYPGQLHQLFQNLVSNAVKFRGEAPLHVEIGCRREPGLWHFTIADNGIGIEPREAVRIFDLFARSRRAQSAAGSGIGLAVAKRVVERHRGNIWVESAPDSGTTVHFTIPLELRRRTDPRVLD